MRKQLLYYTVSGSLPCYLVHDVPNPKHMAKVYVCARTLRDMLALIHKHMPEETISHCDVTLFAEKSWPPHMRWLKGRPGVWASRSVGGCRVYQMIDGTSTETDG